MATFNICIMPFLFCSIVLLLSNPVGGAEYDISLTLAEEHEIDNQLKSLNKPAIKTIKTTYGDLYDCVDFYKQPAFDHPLLKNHTFHPRMRPINPSSMSKRTRKIAKSQGENIGLVRVGCPFGTVPIKRVTKEDLVRAKLLEKESLKYSTLGIDQEPGRHYAIGRTREDPDWKYHGGSAYISIYNVSIQDNRQYSLARVRVQCGTDSIEVGTMTNPAIYNNLDTHLFIRTKTSKIDCFNLLCPGFVVVQNDFPIDYGLQRVSRRGDKYKINALFSIYKGKDGNWWYDYNTNPGVQMGFWPSAMFEGGLNNGSATSVDWGGEAFGPVGIPSPPMGSSEFPKADAIYDGYCGKMKTKNIADNEPDIYKLDLYVTGNYGVVDNQFDGENRRHIMYFGGPGGD